MKIIFDYLFGISEGLLIPVIVLLLLLVLRALWVMLGAFGIYRRHLRVSAVFARLLEDISVSSVSAAAVQLVESGDNRLAWQLGDMAAHSGDAPYCEHLLADYEIEIDRCLSRSRLLVKLGPMTGLMGTLIPMGPALAALASGNVSAMAYNMQIAFATTVIGVLVAAIGAVALQFERRVYARRLNDLEYICKTLNTIKAETDASA